MFKIFESRVCSFIFTLFILFFVQTVEGNASFVQNQFREEGIVATLEKRVVTQAVDKAVIYDIEGQNGFSFVKGILGIGKGKDHGKDPGKNPGKDPGKNKGSRFFGSEFNFNFNLEKGFATMLGGTCVIGLVASFCIGDLMGVAASLLGMATSLAIYTDDEE
ncbi:hypothetical protein [Bartonella krasnovii]|uniref:Uncharacterized protein n=1 Tax=Bartonella krasnovii TaxID=2267275 RepID=A0ABY3VWM0_9HYPH|nr:hypothetical protein [Bartonella krasnovii]UNF28691.1 hypothetical protein MNL13_05560 [Bartonella krasnovii]UNF35067.1 hypothetical protein MNL12_05565 [Bartonella krasnovii]UNF36697.1 hypothetical protein MNL11_06275 [Bartonella krasnovii]UNF38324.1 hypothetical protein MNL10_06125 [Bartonella krasnovii]UNF41766.1 hypothetical protein MNL08_06165 [Bartonella krasnovii]